MHEVFFGYRSKRQQRRFIINTVNIDWENRLEFLSARVSCLCFDSNWLMILTFLLKWKLSFTSRASICFSLSRKKNKIGVSFFFSCYYSLARRIKLTQSNDAEMYQLDFFSLHISNFAKRKSAHHTAVECVIITENLFPTRLRKRSWVKKRKEVDHEWGCWPYSYCKLKLVWTSGRDWIYW